MKELKSKLFRKPTPSLKKKRIDSVEDVFNNLELKKCEPDSISEVKRLFNEIALRETRKLARRNRELLGFPSSDTCKKIVKRLTKFRKNLIENKIDELDPLINELDELDFKKLLRNFISHPDNKKSSIEEKSEFEINEEEIFSNKDGNIKRSRLQINQGEVLTNEQLCETFLCSPQGGMRRSHEKNTLVLVSNHVKSIYDDKWKGDTLHYTGMGGSGDQSISFMQNKTLNESVRTDIEIHLFEVFEEKQYFYQGRVKLKSNPYQEIQTDENGETRKVWMFPLEIINGRPARIEFKIIEKLRQKKEKKASKISSELLKKMVENQPKSKPSKRTTSSETYERDEKVVKYALLRANGICELCEKKAPFNKKDGSPFLEVHHIDFLSNRGDDTIENVSALCPNCHRKMHALEIKEDIEKLKAKAKIKLVVDD